MSEPDEDTLRSIGVDGLIELVGVLRRDCRLAHEAADAAAEAVGATADKLSTVWVERDRLRAIAEAAKEAVDTHRKWLATAQNRGSRPTDDEIHYRAAAFATLAMLVDRLDRSGVMDGEDKT